MMSEPSSPGEFARADEGHLRRRVFEELVNLSAYLAEDREDIAQSFLDSCDATFRFLASNPHVGVQRQFNDPALSDVRMWRVKDFNKYLIFYIPTEAGVKILHIVHSARDYTRLFEPN